MNSNASEQPQEEKNYRFESNPLRLPGFDWRVIVKDTGRGAVMDYEFRGGIVGNNWQPSVAYLPGCLPEKLLRPNQAQVEAALAAPASGASAPASPDDGATLTIEDNPSGETPWKVDASTDTIVRLIDRNGVTLAMVWANRAGDLLEFEYAEVRVDSRGQGVYGRLLARVSERFTIISDEPRNNAAKGAYVTHGAREMSNGRLILERKREHAQEVSQAESASPPQSKTIGADAFRDGARDVVLAALDTYMRTLTQSDRALGARDSDLPMLFAALDAHMDRVAARFNAPESKEVGSAFLSIVK